MSNKFNKEVLLENLPDFIEGKIEDGILKEAINKEISANQEFKDEYDSLAETIGHIKNYMLSEPPVNYFNNLLPELNKRIYRDDRRFNFSKSISLLWKIAIPAAAIFLFFFSYRSFINQNELTVSDKKDTQTSVLKETGKNQKTEELSEVNNSEDADDESDNIYDYENIMEFFGEVTNNRKNTNPPVKTVSNVQIDLSENSTDEDIFFSNDEDNFEQIFENMNTDEQKEVLNKIKNSKL
jgi:hypothetical protein